ncbi:MAG: endonuclease/exonuclease/phosphatase family protein [Bacteroidales bacterium]|nr:endonuclease/exonuclease/phosphatase family protein [Bacteroidales bacterium]
MKVKFKFFCCLLLAAGFVACSQKEEPLVPEEEITPSTEETDGEFSYVFKVGNPETKTSFDTDHVAWNADDLVASYALTSLNKSTPVTIDGSGIPHITIRSSVALSAGDMVYAYYPHSSANNSKEADAVTLEIPRNQVSGSADAMPMVALPFELTGDVPKYTNQEVGTIRFLNLGSVVKLNIYSSNASYQGETIENVTFQAGVACAGTFTYDLTTANASFPAAISGYTETDVVVTGNGASPITVGTNSSNGGVFYFVVAPGTYSGTFKIRTNKAEYTYVSGSSREYKRAGLKPLNLDLASANWTPVIGGYDTSIDSPREFAAFLAGTDSGDTGDYTITADLDMTGYTITSASGFGGTLDGGNHSIKNLSSSVPMFATNAGTIQNLIIDASCTFTAGSKEFAPLVKIDNGGTYTSVRNKADVTLTATANETEQIILGGLVAVASGSTFTSCTNSGEIKYDATGYNHKQVALGGLIGLIDNSSANSSINSCVNRGPVTLLAVYGDPNVSFTYGGDGNSKGINLAGIAAVSTYNGTYKASFDQCENETAGTIYLKHTDITGLAADTGNTGPVCVTGILGMGQADFNKCKNFALIKAESLITGDPSESEMKKKNYLLAVAGISGMGWDVLGMSSCTNSGNIEVEYYGLYDADDKWRAAVGGICAYPGYNTGSYAYYCKMEGDITVTGKGTMAVGGIFGWSGKQIKNNVTSDCSISVNGRKGDVGGLVGYVAGGADNYTIKGCTCAATIFADSDWGSAGKDWYYAIGGLMGRWGGANSGSYPSMTNRDGDPCVFSGSISSVYQVRVGVVVGRVYGSSKTIVFGESGNPIQATGTIERGGLSQTAITSANIETYKCGQNANTGTTTIYVTCPDTKVACLNIREGSHWSDRKGAIVAMINGEHPAIIGLQEVKDLDYWDHLTEDHPWDYLKDNLSAYTGYRASTDDCHTPFLYDSSILTVTGTGCFWLRDNYSTAGDSWDGYVRSVTYANIYNKNSKKNYFFVNAHLPLSSDGQVNAMELLESRISALNTNGYPVILMGDFNTVYSNDDAFGSIKTKMYNTRYSATSVLSTENRDLYTYNAFGDSSKDRNKVDHIWVSKSVKTLYYLTLTQSVHDYGGYTSNGEKFLSDHYPIIAVIV